MSQRRGFQGGRFAGLAGTRRRTSRILTVPRANIESAGFG